MQNEQDSGLKPFLNLILSTKLPKLALIIGLAGSVLTTLVGLTIPLLTRELVDGFTLESLNIMLIIIIGIVFITQAVVDGLSTYLLAAVGQRIVAAVRERMWRKLIRFACQLF